VTVERGGGGSRFLYAPFQDTQAALGRAEDRLRSLEEIAARIETGRAVDEEKQKRMEARFDVVDKRLDRIDGLVARLAWLIVTAIVGGFMTMLLAGGLPRV
jgi:hypothetical protein